MKLPVVSCGLLPRNAVGAAVPSTSRLVTIPVDPLRVPVGLAAGDVVDVWASAPKANDGAPPIPTQVLTNIRVADVDREASAMSGALPVVLDIAQSQTAQLIGATRADISLVLVPMPSQSFYGAILQ
jgi:Flp pilus assembly protein CpaB